MILIDANLLIYAHNTEAPQHRAAQEWLESIMSGQDPVRLPWAALLAFLRLITNSRVMAHPKSLTDACAIVSEWLAQPHVDILEPTARHWEVLQEVLTAGQALGPLVTDAHLAALAIEHGATVYTTDRDFARFPGLKWKNPLE